MDPEEFEIVKKQAVMDMRAHPNHPDRQSAGTATPPTPIAESPPGSPERLARRREIELKVGTHTNQRVNMTSPPASL